MFSQSDWTVKHRKRFGEIKIDPANISPPISRNSKDTSISNHYGVRNGLNSGKKNDLSGRDSHVMEALSQPVGVPQAMDMLIDDVAAAVNSSVGVSPHMSQEDSVLVTLKPVTGILIN